MKKNGVNKNKNKGVYKSLERVLKMELCPDCIYLEIALFAFVFLFLCSVLYNLCAYRKVKKELDEYKTKDLIKSTIEEIVR